jgi:hemoglobin
VPQWGAITDAERRRRVALFLETAEEVGLPEDPEFRSALAGYLAWSSRLAVINSQPGAAADPPRADAAMGMGEVKGPYVG